MKFCCGVTLFYPSKEEVNAIKKYKDIFECIYLFDNTDSEDRLKNEKYYQDNKGFIYISNSKNEGLSLAYNIMCQRAIADGYDYICFFDQDSLINAKDLIKMIDYIKIDTKIDTAVYVPEIIYKHENNSMEDMGEKSIGVEVEWAISSGSFINLNIYQKTQGFDENYFIDRLDYDYCITVRRLGYKVIKIKNTFLYQTLGEQGKGIFKNVSQHSPIRHYYIFRNRLYFYLNKSQPPICRVIKVSLLSMKHIGKVMLLEKCKVQKIIMILHGIKDFYRNRMGKYQ